MPSLGFIDVLQATTEAETDKSAETNKSPDEPPDGSTNGDDC